MEHNGIDLPAWIEAIAVTATLFASMYLPRRDRADARKEDASIKTAALVAIAKRVKKTIESLRRRANQGFVLRSEVGWLEDETLAASRMADNVDLTSLSDGGLVEEFAEVQQAARTAHRRLRQITTSAAAGATKLTVPGDKFEDPFNRISKALEQLEARLTA